MQKDDKIKNMNEIIYFGSLVPHYREADMVVGIQGIAPTVKENHGKGACVVVRKKDESCNKSSADIVYH